MTSLQQNGAKKYRNGNGNGNGNGHSNGHSSRRPYPELVVTPPLTEQEATYQAALKLVARIDDDLTRGVRHYRTVDGELLTTLDEVVNAILDNSLQVEEEARQLDVIWSTRHELAA